MREFIFTLLSWFVALAIILATMAILASCTVVNVQIGNKEEKKVDL